MKHKSQLKAMGLFDHLTNLFTKKIKWDDMNQSDQKTFSSFMINRFLSMDIDLIDTVNYIQSITYGLDASLVYKIYFDILPARKGFFVKYIKGDKTKKYNDELIELIKDNLTISKNEVIEFLDLGFNIEPYLKRFGLNEKEIKKLTKVNNDVE